MTKKYMYEQKIRKEICRIGRIMYEKGFVAANDGNISVRLNSDEYIFTPTNVSKGSMKPGMLVKTDKSGRVVKGPHGVSSEYMMHLRVYSENPEINAVVHAHPLAATSYAIAGVPLDKALLVEAVVLLGIVPVAPYGLTGTKEVPDSIAPYCKEYNAVLMKNHGVLTWGKNLTEAFFRMEAVENYAKITTYSDREFAGRGRLSSSQINALIKIRDKIGINAGGIPKSED